MFNLLTDTEYNEHDLELWIDNNIDDYIDNRNLDNYYYIDNDDKDNKNLERLNKIKYLNTLIIYNSNNLTRIINIPGLKTLILNNCNNIFIIKNLYNLENLYINNCENIKFINNDILKNINLIIRDDNDKLIINYDHLIFHNLISKLF